MRLPRLCAMFNIVLSACIECEECSCWRRSGACVRARVVWCDTRVRACVRACVRECVSE